MYCLRYKIADIRCAALNVHASKVAPPSYVDIVIKGDFKIKKGALSIAVHPDTPVGDIRFDCLMKVYGSGDVFEIHCFKIIFHLNDIKKRCYRNLLKLVIS